ncbi:hypothetical protein [Bifidobacterium magnum]|uniref:Uncharacterized protein n=1 Tax=Bifidobacterium magnum TaxID=1692 RepID=A0A087B9A8_9BIFI|nr:hypothetical protein [Bifidobacterium magnum]KFI67608.1 hypothetical protein BMAGN_0811 [Bifidobacterium magnum]
MDKAVWNGSGDIISAQQLWRKYYPARPPESIRRRLRCPECNRPVVAAGFTIASSVTPFFRHQKDDPVAQHCSLYNSNEDESAESFDPTTSRRAILFPLYLREQEHVWHVELGINGMGQEERKLLHDSSIGLRVHTKSYGIWHFASQPEFKVPVRPFPTRLSLVVKVVDGQGLVSVPDFFREERDTLIFNDSFGKHGGRHILPNGKIYVGEEYFLMTQQYLDDHARKSLHAKYLGKVQGEGRNFTVFSMCVEDTEDMAILQNCARILSRFGYRLTERSNDTVLLWPPSATIDYMDSPVFENTPVYYANDFQQTDSSTGNDMFRHFPYADNGRNITVGIGPGPEMLIKGHSWDGSMLSILFSDSEEWVSLLPDYDDIDHLHLAESTDAPVLGSAETENTGERLLESGARTSIRPTRLRCIIPILIKCCKTAIPVNGHTSYLYKQPRLPKSNGKVPVYPFSQYVGDSVTGTWTRS